MLEHFLFFYANGFKVVHEGSHGNLFIHSFIFMQRVGKFLLLLSCMIKDHESAFFFKNSSAILRC